MTSASNLLFEIEELIPTLEGWCTPERACEYASIIMALKPQVSCCIGTFGGRDTFAMALAHRFNGFGKVLTIDPWSAADSVIGQTGENAEWWASQSRHDAVYGSFLTHLAALELGDWIDVQKKRAVDVTPPLAIGLLIIDGNHGPDSVKDVERWGPNVRIGGLVYADDITWPGGNVAIAVERLKKMGFVELYKRDTGVFFQRVAHADVRLIGEARIRTNAKIAITAAKKRRARA